MWIKHLSMLSLLLWLGGNIQSADAADCNKWLFLCEHSTISIPDDLDSKSIRVPMLSSNCNEAGTPAFCKSTLKAKRGQKLLVKTGLVFEVGLGTSPCNESRHMMFFSGDQSFKKSHRQCGSIGARTELFESTNEEVGVEYKSNSGTDGALLQITAFGCPADSFAAPNIYTNLTLTSEDFGAEDTQYEGSVGCDEGYLMEGFVSTKPILCVTSFTGPGNAMKKWEWDITPENLAQYTCRRVKCESLIPPVNGRHELSNDLYHLSTATFHCGAGYTLNGNSTQSCIVENGTRPYWRGEPPTCKIINCGVPLIYNSTYTLPAITTYQANFEYKCDAGLKPAFASAVCLANGIWGYTPCEAVTCPLPPTVPDWALTSPDSRSQFLLEEMLTYLCIHDDERVSITCKPSKTDSHSANWTSLPSSCRKRVSQSPLERRTAAAAVKPTTQTNVGNEGAIIGGIIAGIIFSMIIIIVACVLVKRSSARRRAARNNNSDEKEKLKKRENERPSKPQRAHQETSPLAQPDADVEKEVELAAVVHHYKNRGNNRNQNNSNGSGMMGTTSSKASRESALSVELLETGDLYDSVMNGRRDVMSGRRSTSSDKYSKEKDSPRDRKSEETDSLRHRKLEETDSLRDEIAVSKIENELNESQLNGIMGPNKRNSGAIFENLITA